MKDLNYTDITWIPRSRCQTTGRVTLSFALADILVDAGVKYAFGIVGGGNAPLAEALDLSAIEVWHTRHESGAGFAATEASLASGSPVVVFVTTGPGLLNVLNGVCAARWDGATVILLSGSTNPEHKGRWPVQETSSYTMPIGDLYAAGKFFDFAVQMNSIAELSQIRRRIFTGIVRPQGFVAHISLPLALQTALVPMHKERTETSVYFSKTSVSGIDRVASLLAGSPSAIWVGFGARHAAAEILDLAERTESAVMCTPRAKGIFPEDHPLYLGVTGAGGHVSAEEYMERIHPDYVLVLGTRMGEASSFWSDRLIPQKGFIQVDVDPSATGVAFPNTPVIGIQSEIGAFLREFTSRLPKTVEAKGRTGCFLTAPPRLVPRTEGSVRPRYLMQVLQQRVVEGSDALLMSESGNAFSWANHYLRFLEPDRYRTSALYGSMGHIVAGVVGAALALDKKAVAIVGDGAMLMNNEISTAVSYNAKAVWVVLNDSRYGITHQAMKAQGFNPVATEIPATDFVALAKSMGADGVRVTTETSLDMAMEAALRADVPFVVDVVIDRSEISPVLRKRIDSLKKQGAVGANDTNESGEDS